MTEFSERLLLDGTRKRGVSRFRPAFFVIAPLAAILFQLYLARFVPFISRLELPLLVTVYFSLMRRQPVAGTLFGAAVGLLQDALRAQPVGMAGIVKTLVGYFAASVSLRFDVENVVVRFVLGLFFFYFHEFFYWVLGRALLGQTLSFNVAQTAISALLNAAVAVPLFYLLDKTKER